MELCAINLLLLHHCLSWWCPEVLLLLKQRLWLPPQLNVCAECRTSYCSGSPPTHLAIGNPYRFSRRKTECLLWLEMCTYIHAYMCRHMFVYLNSLSELWEKSTNGFQLWVPTSIISLAYFWGGDRMSDFGECSSSYLWIDQNVVTTRWPINPPSPNITNCTGFSME